MLIIEWIIFVVGIVFLVLFYCCFYFFLNVDEMRLDDVDLGSYKRVKFFYKRVCWELNGNENGMIVIIVIIVVVILFSFCNVIDV